MEKLQSEENDLMYKALGELTKLYQKSQGKIDFEEDDKAARHTKYVYLHLSILVNWWTKSMNWWSPRKGILKQTNVNMLYL